MLFIYKSRLLSSVLPVDPVTYIVTNITFFGYNLHLLPGMKPVASSSLTYIWRLCDSQDMMLERTSKSVTLGMPISCPACRACQTQLASRSACPACQTRRAKTGNESSARREIWEHSSSCSLFPILCFTTEWSFLIGWFCRVGFTGFLFGMVLMLSLRGQGW